MNCSQRRDTVDQHAAVNDVPIYKKGKKGLIDVICLKHLLAFCPFCTVIHLGFQAQLTFTRHADKCPTTDRGEY
jgi:hypothetical protein